ncbi:MAG: hypothetical protein ACOWWR_18710 [Eubacteriales bacterium]
MNDCNMNPLKQAYINLHNLQYSDEDIAELFFLSNDVIRFLESQDPNEETNEALHFVKLAWNKEFKYFEDKNIQNMEYNFNEARTSLMSDLTHNCQKYWDPDKDPWH